MTVLRLDDHLPPEDRETVALLRREAERVEPSHGADLEAVLLSGRRRAARRRYGALAVAAAAAAVTAAVAAGTAPVQPVVPAQPVPEVTVVPTQRSASAHYARVEQAMADAGIVVDGEPRWRSERKVDGGVLWSGFTTRVYVPSAGASLMMSSLRRAGAGPEPADDGCAPVVGAFEDAGEPVTCEESDVAGGRLVVAAGQGWSAATLSTPSTRVTAESSVDTLGSGPQVQNPAALPAQTLAELAADPRLRW